MDFIQHQTDVVQTVWIGVMKTWLASPSHVDRIIVLGGETINASIIMNSLPNQIIPQRRALRSYRSQVSLR